MKFSIAIAALFSTVALASPFETRACANAYEECNTAADCCFGFVCNKTPNGPKKLCEYF